LTGDGNFGYILKVAVKDQRRRFERMATIKKAVKKAVKKPAKKAVKKTASKAKKVVKKTARKK
jgi:hypothetical protein